MVVENNGFPEPDEECDLCKHINEEIEKKNFEYLKKLKKTLENM